MQDLLCIPVASQERHARFRFTITTGRKHAGFEMELFNGCSLPACPQAKAYFRIMTGSETPFVVPVKPGSGSQA